jgi:hypothetical protein
LAEAIHRLGLFVADEGHFMRNKQILIRRLAVVLNKAVKAQCGSDWDREDSHAIAAHMIGLNRKPKHKPAKRAA